MPSGEAGPHEFRPSELKETARYEYGTQQLASDCHGFRPDRIRRLLYATRRRLRVSSVAGLPERELGAFRCAPVSTPTPSRSTSSPPNQPVIKANPIATNDKAKATELGLCGAGRRRNQLPIKSSTTTTLPAPCQRPIAFALVLAGIAHQSIKPKTAESSPPTIPAHACDFSPNFQSGMGFSNKKALPY